MVTIIVFPLGLFPGCAGSYLLGWIWEGVPGVTEMFCPEKETRDEDVLRAYVNLQKRIVLLCAVLDRFTPVFQQENYAIFLEREKIVISDLQVIRIIQKMTH